MVYYMAKSIPIVADYIWYILCCYGRVN